MATTAGLTMSTENGLTITDLPSELIVTILSYCSIFDLCSVAMTCKKLRECAESRFIWKKKWTVLAEKSSLWFSCFSLNDVCYKDLCKRLWKVCFRGQSLPHCIHCKKTTCLESCLMNWERKTVIDIGSKMTWLLTTTFSMRRHPTLVAVPKLTPTCCHDHGGSDCSDDAEVMGNGNDLCCSGAESSDSKFQCYGTPPYSPRNLSSALHLPDQHQGNSASTCNTVFSVPNMCKPVCILCNPEKAEQILSNWKHWRNMNSGSGRCVYVPTEHYVRQCPRPETAECDADNHNTVRVGSESPLHKSSNTQNSECNHNRVLSHSPPPEKQRVTCLCDSPQKPNLSQLQRAHSGWQSSLWSDIMGYLFGDIGDWQMVSPLDYFTGESDMRTLAFYLEHVLSQYKMLYEIRKPSVTLVLCEPVTCTPEMRKKVTTMLFEKLQVSRLCFLNKAVAVARLIAQDTCIVIDSGANNTVVTLIVDGEARLNQRHHAAVGGVAVAQYLAHAIEWNGIMQNVALSSLDTTQVKSNCHLSYNLATEERRKAPIKHSIFVRSHSDMAGSPTKLQKIELGPELYLAPEMMYASLQLPEMVRDSIAGLSNGDTRDALSHIILTGGNTELQGFATRLMKDLRVLLPEFSGIINVHTYAGSRSWDAAMGATRIPVPIPCCPEIFPNHPGQPMWITRESYIVYGTDILC